MKIIIVAVVLVGVAVLLMALGIILKKNGKFPNTHIGGNKEMSKRGIYCATTTDKVERRSKGRFDFKKLENEVEDSISC
jgi:hypothetical protein